MRAQFKADWGVSETGAAGPTGNPYGDAAGHSCIAVASRTGCVERTLETGRPERLDNMVAFSDAALQLLLAEIEKS